MNNQAPKSVGVAFLLTFIFGPLGVFYSSITGGVVMLLVSFFGGILFGLVTFGFGLVVWVPMVWVASIIWGCLAVSSSGNTTVINR